MDRPSSIPKFTSFKPKPVPRPQHASKAEERRQTGDEVEQLRERQDQDHNRTNHKDHGTNKRKSGSQSLLRLISSPENPPLSTGKSSQSHRSLPSAKGEWFYDWKGDSGILHFGFSDRSTVPSYRAPVAPWCLGLTAAQRAQSTTHASPLTSLGKVSAARIDVYRPKLVKALDFNMNEDIHRESGFIPLRTPLNRKRGVQDHSEGQYTSEEDYEKSDVELGNAHSIASKAQISHSKQAPTRAQNTALQRKVKEEPANAKAWLDLVDFQKTWAARGLSTSEIGTTRQLDPAIVADLELSVLRDALKAISDVSDKETILRKMMKTLGMTLDRSQLLARWQNVLHSNPTMSKLHRDFVRTLWTDDVHFQFERCQRQFRLYMASCQDCAETLIAFEDYTTFLWNAGFQEFATASWQMLLELKYFGPTDASDSNSLKNMFENFWDSEKPRIGEARSSGWCNGGLSASGPLLANIGSVQDKTRMSHWAQNELRQCLLNVLPGRTADEDESEDPYHVVFFSDLEPLYLSCVQNHSGREVINSFLRFSGLPTLGELQHSLEGNRSSHVFDTSDTVTLLDWQLQQPIMTLDTLLGGDCSYFQASVRRSQNRSEIVQNTLRSLVDNGYGDDELEEYYLGMSCALSPKRAKGVAKALLKKRPTRMRLYNSYGLIEAASEPGGAWSRVFQTAIDMSVTFNKEEQSHVVLLWRTWLFQACQQSKEDALRVLMTIGSPTAHHASKTPIINLLLETDQKLNRGYFSHLTGSQPELCIAYMDCLGLLHYLCDMELRDPEQVLRSTPSLPSAFAIHVKCLTTLSNRLNGLELEIAHQSFAFMVSRHVAKYGRRMAHDDLAAIVGFFRAIAGTYPENSAIIHAYSVLQPHAERIRALIPAARHSDVLAAPQTLAAWGAVIKREMRLSHAAGGSTVAVRRAFERAAASLERLNNTSIWTWWFYWEVSLANSAHEAPKALLRAKEVWLRGSQLTPGDKWWILMGLKVLGGTISNEEATQHVELMVEKGLRLCVKPNETPSYTGNA